MSNAMIEKLTEERAGLVEFVDQTLAKATGRDLVEAELSNLASTQERMAAIDLQLKPLAEFEALRQSAVRMDRITQRPTAPAPQTRGFDFGGGQVRSFGDRYVEEESFATRGAMGTRYDDESLSALDLARQTRAVLVEGSAPGSNLLPNPYKYTAAAPEFTTPLLDMITSVPVTTSSVDILKYGPEVTGADVVPEAQDKPEGQIVTGVTPTPLETIAVWVQYSRQLADDAPALRALLNSGMTRGVLRKLQTEVADAILVLRKLQTEVADAILAANLPDTTGGAGQGAIEVVRSGMANVEAAGYNPNVLLGSPTDLAQLDISVLNLGGAAATVLGGGSWGLRPIAVPGLPNMIVADAASAFVLFVRNGVQVYTTDSDIVGSGATAKSGFRSNVLTTLAEIRAKGAVQDPNAATDIILTPATP